MGPVLATEGLSHQTKKYTPYQWCVKGNAAGAGAINDRKWTNKSTEGWGSNNLPNQSAYLVLKTHRNWYKSLRRTQKAA
jgi:hypothetical protein